jgi:hypothetical protein
MRARIADEDAMLALSMQGIIGAVILYVATYTTVQFFSAKLVADAVVRLDGPYRLRLGGGVSRCHVFRRLLPTRCCPRVWCSNHSW